MLLAIENKTAKNLIVRNYQDQPSLLYWRLTISAMQPPIVQIEFKISKSWRRGEVDTTFIVEQRSVPSDKPEVKIASGHSVGVNPIWAISI
jgi:hypothetical protein